MNTTQKQNSTATAGGHTPGPWEADVKSYRLPMVINSTGKMTVANSIFGESAEIAEANARLIAQAPTLAYIAQRWMNWTQNGVQPIAVRIQLEADTKAVLAALEDSK